MLEQTKGDKHGFELKVNLNWKSISLEAMSFKRNMKTAATGGSPTFKRL